MAPMSIFMRLAYLILLQLFSASSIDSSEHENEEKTETITVINATQDSLTLKSNLMCGSVYCDDDMITWVYAKYASHLDLHRRSSLHVEKLSHRTVKITNLSPGSTYVVRVERREALPESENEKIASTTALTCPETPEKIDHIHIYEKGFDFLNVLWSAPTSYCASTAYYIRWFEYDEDNHNWNTKFGGVCPKDWVFVANTSAIHCEDDPETICYTIKGNLTGTTRYMVEVSTTDASGLCSDPNYAYAKTRYDYWGGITIGGWCLIVMCFILALGAVPIVIRLKKRLVMHVSRKQNIVFKRSATNEDYIDDEERDPDGYLISNTNDPNIEIQPNQS